MPSNASIALPGFKGLPLRVFLKRLVQRIREDNVLDGAAQLAYYFVLALFPLLFFLVTLTAYLPLRHPMELALKRLGDLLPAQSLELVQAQMDSLLDNPRPKLLTLSLLVALWTASRALDGVRKSLNLAYRVTEARSFLRTEWLALWTTVVCSLLFLVGFSMVILGGRAGQWLAARVGAQAQFAVIWWRWLRWPSTALLIMLVAALVFYWLPDVEQKFKFITPGSVAATLLWLLCTWGFTMYADNFGSFNVTYGSLGAAMILLTWLYLTGLFFILGGEINAVIEQATAGGKQPGARHFGAGPEQGALVTTPPGVATRRRAAVRARLQGWLHRRRGPETPHPRD